MPSAKPELPDSADCGAFDPFFAAIGRLIVSWGHLEQALDTVIRIIHTGNTTPKPDCEFPRALDLKIEYFRQASAASIAPEPTRAAYKSLCKEIDKHADFRHSVVHGFMKKFDEGGFGAKFGRYHRTKPLGQIQAYHITIEMVSAEAILVQDHARLLFRLGGNLLDLEREQ